MDLEQIVQQILMVRRDLSREEVLKKIYEKKRSAEDYFLDDVAARLVASDLGVEIPSAENSLHPEIAIKNLVSGLNDVTIVGRVITVYPIQTFSRPDLTEGKVARLRLADKTGSLRLVLWNDKISIVESDKIRQGQIIRVSHCYVREGLDGKLELHLGRKGELEISPPDVAESDYPKISDFIGKIGELTVKKKRASVSGLVTEVFPISEFERRDGSAGKVRRLRLKDDTGETTLVTWNERVDELEEVKLGDRLQVMDARVKKQLDGRLELHVQKATQIEKLVGQALPTPTAPKQTTRKIADLKEEGGPFNIEATVASTPNIREVTTAYKERVLVASFDLADETGKIRMSLWRKQAEIAKELSVGTQIRVKNAYSKKGFSNLLQLVSRTSTVVEIVSKPEAVGAENKTE